MKANFTSDGKLYDAISINIIDIGVITIVGTG